MNFTQGRVQEKAKLPSTPILGDGIKCKHVLSVLEWSYVVHEKVFLELELFGSFKIGVHTDLPSLLKNI